MMCIFYLSYYLSFNSEHLPKTEAKFFNKISWTVQAGKILIKNWHLFVIISSMWLIDTACINVYLSD